MQHPQEHDELEFVQELDEDELSYFPVGSHGSSLHAAVLNNKADNPPIIPNFIFSASVLAMSLQNLLSLYLLLFFIYKSKSDNLFILPFY